MSDIKSYYCINDENLREVLKKILNNDIAELGSHKVHHHVLFIEEGCIPYEKIKILSEENIILFFTSEETKEFPKNSNILLLEKKRFIKEAEFCSKFILFIVDFYENIILKLNEYEDKIFGLAMSSVDMLERHENLYEQIAKDGLTGLYNHTAFQDRLSKLFRSYKHNKTTFSVAMLDLDFFKKVNDTYGHLKGDEVLKQFADIIKKCVRKNDFPARYGGEEFAIIFSDINKFEAEAIIDRLREKFKKIKFKSDSGSFGVTFSAGLAEVNESMDTPSEITNAADTALYYSKRSGRNKTTLA
ncbi:MAG: diguanylate cyclase [Deferribacteraceae bacterium]|jgi:diguanylate cyclase (GGDEF)-like protein|nr:diguanylate cyclase [Deferribacteraceae bacterium]